MSQLRSLLCAAILVALTSPSLAQHSPGLLNFERDFNRPPSKSYRNPVIVSPSKIRFDNVPFGHDTCAVLLLRHDDSTSAGDRVDSLHLQTNAFTCTSASSLPFPIETGDSLAISVCYPGRRDRAEHRDTLSIYFNCVYYAVPLVGRSVDPNITASDLDFGEVAVGNTSIRTVKVTNLGVDTARMWGARVEGSNRVTLLDTSSVTTVIPPGHSQFYSVAYAPISGTPDSATIIWNTNASGLKMYSVIVGTGVVLSVDSNVARPEAMHQVRGRDLVFKATSQMTIEVFDVLGRMTRNCSIDREGAIRGLASGKYFVRIYTHGHCENAMVVVP